MLLNSGNTAHTPDTSYSLTSLAKLTEYELPKTVCKFSPFGVLASSVVLFIGVDYSLKDLEMVPNGTHEV